MNKLILYFFVGFIISSPCLSAQVIPNFGFQNLNGDSVNISEYSGKKLMVVMLPITKSLEDSSFIIKINNFLDSHHDSVSFLGVLSNEEGYNESIKSDLQHWFYTQLDMEYKIVKNIYTHTGSEQSGFVKWLSNEEDNGHFNLVIDSPFKVFLINERGELKSIVNSANISSETLENVLNSVSEN